MMTIGPLIVAVRRGKLTLRWTPLACISLHALARRIERSAERDHTALARDLAVLAQANDVGERVNTQGGFWLGSVIEAMNDAERKGCTIRNVRTWLAT
jgi:hypothetical protein